jgi:hypothetical protein
MQCAVNTTIEEAVFSMWFVYIHCGATDVFSMDAPGDYISGTEPRESIVERMRMERVLCSQGRRVRPKIDCD